MSAQETQPRGPLAWRIATQAALLLSGLAASQGFSLARNALLGHWLSKGDFGIAATLTLLLQLIDQLSDLGADRLVVQAREEQVSRLVATAHATLVVRGVLMALALVLLAGPVAEFFAIPQARWAFMVAALVPLLKGFQNLDPRRAQARLHNRPQLLVEVIPQAAALAATLPALVLDPTYGAVLWLSLIQAAASLVAAHALSVTPYRLALDRDLLRRIISFGWPIWASAFPLVAVYQGDRILIGRYLGMEALAAYSVAFLMTMVPGLVAAKAGHALMLPLLAEAEGDASRFKERFRLMCEVTALAAALYLAAFIVAGGAILPLAFGPNYRGQEVLLAWLALMWSLRMVQAVPGMGLMALGDTRPLLIAGLIRAAALVPAALAAVDGAGVETIAAIGVAGELASLVYVAGRFGASREGLGNMLLGRSALLAPAGILALLTHQGLGAHTGLTATLGTALAVCLAILAAAVLALPALRALLPFGARGRALPAAPL